MRRFAVGVALAWLLATGPGCRLLATAARSEGPQGGPGQVVVSVLPGAGEFAAARTGFPPSPEQDAQTLAIVGGHALPQLAAVGVSAEPDGDFRRLRLELPHPQRGPPPFA